ncbi:uncharacterized protein GIQ15_03156 [Arthroderma uncinatum]|uniref:uncharacterized protein n=1 Tax=Arthroderma uncinatum TaxID=74035 RepID=UPI00144A6946|nr:uncharacterized protein GIQ15_03156 [Arthroderma uncinatum]KAF3483832.1 hypothetical protein GIQ15_03156 [Arthroderma uncinatum]
MPEKLNVIALISGGKDSLYTTLHCLKNGHKVVALANLYPPPRPGRPGAKGDEAEEDEDLDSYMYQTVGYSMIPLYESALDIPLFREEIRGSAIDTSRDYYYRPDPNIGDGTDQAQNNEKGQDETESIYRLLRRVMDAHPEANSVCAGAVLSTYQRTRIENVALRLNLIPLAWLWMYPYLPPPVQRGNYDAGPCATASRVPVTGLLDDMAACGCEARIIKVASGGLDEDNLWGDLASKDGAVRRSMVKKLGRFLEEGVEAAVLGEGGEYESLALDGPQVLWKRKIQVDSVESKVGEAGVAFLTIRGARCVEKEAVPENGDKPTLDDVRVPRIFDDEFKRVLDATKVHCVKQDPSPFQRQITKKYEGAAVYSKGTGVCLNVYNITAPEAGNGASKQMEGIKDKLATLLSSQKKVDGQALTADDAIYATILLRSMGDFAPVNTIYSKLFTLPNPPARATVACGDSLPIGVDIMVSFTLYLGERSLRQALHVQSRSYWAPANIGPYSQAVYAPVQSNSGAMQTGGFVYIAGQIPLMPSSMQIFPPSEETEGPLTTFSSQAVLSLQHLWRIGKAMEVKWWMGAVVFLSTGDEVRSKAAAAWTIWEQMNEDRSTEDLEDDDDSSNFDVWNMKYGRQYGQPKTEVTTRPLPDFNIVKGKLTIPSFFAVEVDELPRGSSIEWQGLGLKASSIALVYDQVDELQIMHASGPDFGSYTSIAITAKPDIDFRASMQKARRIAADKLSQGSTFSHMAIYTPYAAELDVWDGQSSEWTKFGERKYLLIGVWVKNGSKPSPSGLLRNRFEQNLQLLYDGMATHELTNEGEPECPSAIEIAQEARSHRLPQRSPHPYHRWNQDNATTSTTDSGESLYAWRKPFKTPSDSGTEADDEANGVLKRLPAPPVSRRIEYRFKRGDGEEVITERKGHGNLAVSRRSKKRRAGTPDTEELEFHISIGARLRIEVLRRICETGLILGVAFTVMLRRGVRSVVKAWLIGPSCGGLVLLNIILSLSSLPAATIPLYDFGSYSAMHWLITATPLLISESLPCHSLKQSMLELGLEPELLILIFPLQKSTISIVEYLVTSSLLPTEVQLLGTALINVLLVSQSPQAQILKALVWLGGLCIFVTCKHMLLWEVTLARIPSWKFRRASIQTTDDEHILSAIDRQVCHTLSHPFSADQASESESQVDVARTRGRRASVLYNNFTKLMTAEVDLDKRIFKRSGSTQQSVSMVENDTKNEGSMDSVDDRTQLSRTSSQHIQFSSKAGGTTPIRRTTTKGGRRKRMIPPSMRAFLSLTTEQATIRKWAYAAYSYVMVILIIMVPVRWYVGNYALGGREPFGWAVGYLFGNIPSLRFTLLLWGMEVWACIPPRTYDSSASCHLGWVEHLRRDTVGEANTRLFLCGYCILMLVFGLSLVSRLSRVVEVDTRRKIFHGMMVAMFFPTVFIDPAFVALSCSLVLAIFLLLELFRASQVPPLARELSSFLAPYVDGRDHRGPVIVSHIFLMLGCALPLLLSLAGTPHVGTAPWEGWEVESRDISMVSGIVCVGMGDAAASLVGRRYGQRRWFWGGDKSIEGSLAFAAAVFVGLVTARIWLVVGGWETDVHWLLTIAKSAFAAVASSFMEAVLTGGNDNVVVPLVLWLLVRGLRL